MRLNMAKSKKKAYITEIFRFIFLLGCLTGFLYQTLEFLFLYWKYPTIVDIQKVYRSELELPAFTFCNPIGYNFKEICTGFQVPVCTLMRYHASFRIKQFCTIMPALCTNNQPPNDFKLISFNKFMHLVEFTTEGHDKIRKRLEEYMTCTIEFAGSVKNCSFDYVMGSYYTLEDLPQYCYTIYSLWGKPYGHREKISTAAIMRFHFDVNPFEKANGSQPLKPLYNYPTSGSVQMAVHSPYFLPTPYIEGMNYLGGTSYTLRINMEETRMLPSPYESNCTDYLQTWRERGGKAPVNQLGVFQECRVNKTFESANCIPLDIDYPHAYNVCRACTEECPPPVNVSECSMLTERYNQPCDSITYTVSRKRKAMYVLDEYGIEQKVLERNCSGRRIWDQECFLIDIEAIFDKFGVTKYTYKPKFENLELFSVIGGYMGMWLGISLLASYDTILDIIMRINKYRKRKTKIRNFHDKCNSSEDHFKLSDSMKNGTKPKRKMRRIY